MYQLVRFPSVKIANVWLIDKQQELAKVNKWMEVTHMDTFGEVFGHNDSYCVTIMFIQRG